MQTPLPIVEDPFAELARPAGLDADDLSVHAADFQAAGWMRRYAAVLHRRRAGAAANVLTAWRVPADQTDAFGTRAGTLDAVSHCYLRDTSPDWPHNIYTMIHATDGSQLARVLEEITSAAGDFPRLLLPTQTEYRKAAVRLFDPTFERWEREAAE